MWNKKSPTQYINDASFARRSSAYIDREFQLKYTKYLMIMASISTAAILFPAFILALQNYNIFLDLADQLSPQLSDYLWREKVTLYIVLGTAVIAHMVLWWVFAQKMTAKIVGPAKILRNHVRRVIRGDYSLPLIRLRDDDEFKDLTHAYNYLYTLMRAQTERELHNLRKIADTVTNPMALKLIDELIEERALRLDLASPRAEMLSPLSAANAAKPRDSRHVS